jgi:membrane carboxypeptidase/penicillin-binding protein
VAVRVGFDDNRTLGHKETGSRAALPIFREIMLRLYKERLVGSPPRFPADLEARIDEYLATETQRQAGRDDRPAETVNIARSRRQANSPAQSAVAR